MTQQPNKFKKQGEPISTTSTIDISWNYDDILANQTANILAKLSFQSLEKDQSLPFINQIQVDISGDTSVNTNNSNSWLNLHTFSIANSQDYNTDSFKTYQIQKTALVQANNSDILNILSKTDKFDARVYGMNYAQNYPDIDSRALVFNNLQFLEAQPPSRALFQNESFNSNSITKTYKVEEPEEGNATSSAVISEVITDYSQNETLASSIHPVVTTILSDTENENASANQNFNVVLSNLRSGTNYTYTVKTKNNFRDLHSLYSPAEFLTIYNYLRDNGVSTTLNFNTSQNKTYISTPSSTANLNNSYVYYMNTSTDSTFNLSNTNNQIIQITKPYSVNQQTTRIGYGKWVDNSQNLVIVECYINSTFKQSIQFSGFLTRTNNANGGVATKTNTISNTFNYFSNPSQSDIYSSAKYTRI